MTEKTIIKISIAIAYFVVILIVISLLFNHVSTWIALVELC